MTAPRHTRRACLAALGGAGAALAGVALSGCTFAPRHAEDAFAPPAAPGDARTVLERIAFASCMDQTQPQPIWRTVLAQQPQLAIFGGDNVYASQQPWSAERLAEAYAALAREPHFAALRAAVPTLAIWDDHDYGLNDGGADFPHRAESRRLFLDFWRDPPGSDRVRRADGVYTARRFGPVGRCVQVIALDARWARSAWKPSPQRGAPGMERYVPDDDPAKTMLDDAQWQWLEDRLREPADLRLVVSGIQVVTEGHGWERWGLLPRERQRLFDLIERTRARGVVFLSGDRHLGALYREAAGTPYPLVEMTSSGVTHPWAQAAEAGPNRIGELVTVRHYGWIAVDWAARRVALELRDEDGRMRHGTTIDLDALASPRWTAR